MKRFLLIFLVIVSAACEEDNATPTAPIDDQFDPMDAGVVLLKEGMMAGIDHTVSGTVKIYDNTGEKVIVFDPFTAQNGPDLKVYLSKDENATEYINLGPLKSINGKQSYDVSGMPDLEQYKYVIIWCQQYSVLFGRAEMQ